MVFKIIRYRKFEFLAMDVWGFITVKGVASCIKHYNLRIFKNNQRSERVRYFLVFLKVYLSQCVLFLYINNNC